MKRHILHVLILVTIWNIVSCANQEMHIQVENTIDMTRENEIISLGRETLRPGLDCDQLILAETDQAEAPLMTQTLDLDQDGIWDDLLVQVSLAGNESKIIKLSNTTEALVSPKSKVFGRFVPERMDDFAWENDRIAFRMYGPALEATGEISSGVDVWVKSVDYPIIDKWYSNGNYHKDHGEGADLYKVGPTLGAGGLGLLMDDTLYTAHNFTTYRILADGPLRFVFELDYAPWGSDSIIVKETKRITLDAGKFFNQFESKIEVSQKLGENWMLVAGQLAHPIPGLEPVSVNSSDDYLSVYEPFKLANGSIGTAIVREPLSHNSPIKKYGNQYFMELPNPESGVVAYAAGAGWSKSPWLKNETDWLRIMEAYINQKNNPLRIEILNQN